MDHSHEACRPPPVAEPLQEIVGGRAWLGANGWLVSEFVSLTPHVSSPEMVTLWNSLSRSTSRSLGYWSTRSSPCSLNNLGGEERKGRVEGATVNDRFGSAGILPCSLESPFRKRSFKTSKQDVPHTRHVQDRDNLPANHRERSPELRKGVETVMDT